MDKPVVFTNSECLNITQQNIPEAFGNYFKNKVDLLANTCKVEENVYNGGKIINAQEEFFLTDSIIYTNKFKQLYLKDPLK